MHPLLPRPCCHTLTNTCVVRARVRHERRPNYIVREATDCALNAFIVDSCYLSTARYCVGGRDEGGETTWCTSFTYEAHISTRECTQNIKFFDIRQEPQWTMSARAYSRLSWLYIAFATKWVHQCNAQIHIYFSWPKNQFNCAAISAHSAFTFQRLISM